MREQPGAAPHSVKGGRFVMINEEIRDAAELTFIAC
jgi:hypothetical protein